MRIKRYSRNNYAMNSNWLLMLRHISQYINSTLNGTITSTYIPFIMSEFICTLKVFDNTGENYPIILDYQHLTDKLVKHMPAWLFPRTAWVRFPFTPSVEVERMLYRYLILGYTDVARYMCRNILLRNSAMLKGIYGATPDLFMDLEGILAYEDEDFTIVIEPTWMYDMRELRWMFHDSFTGMMGHINTMSDSLTFDINSNLPEGISNNIPIPVDTARNIYAETFY